MNTYNEEDVINRLQYPETQRAAFGEVVKAYSEQLYWQIRRMVLSHDDANDLLQNTFIKAWSNLNYFRGEAKLSTWLYRIALNESLNFLNKQRAQNQLSIDDEEAMALNKLESDPYFDGDHTQLLFEKAIQTLPEKQRMVFNLKYFQDFSEKLMEQLPEKEVMPEPEIRMWDRIKPWVYMAAMFVGLMFTVRAFVGEQPSSQSTDMEIGNYTEIPDEYLDPIVNQTMMDDYELYQYLTEADNNIYN